MLGKIGSVLGTIVALLVVVVIIFAILYGIYRLVYFTDFQFHPTQDFLYGRWEVVSFTRTQIGGRNTTWHTYFPGHSSWNYGAYIQFNSDGTFSEQYLWTDDFAATGTWILERNTLYLTLDVIDEGHIPFASRRGVSMYIDGNTPNFAGPRLYPYGTDTFLTMGYRRDPGGRVDNVIRSVYHGFRYILVRSDQ